MIEVIVVDSTVVGRQGTLITQEEAWVAEGLHREITQEAEIETVLKVVVLEAEVDLAQELASTQEKTTSMATQRGANSMTKAIMDMVVQEATTREETTMVDQVVTSTDLVITRARAHLTKTEIVSIEFLFLIIYFRN